MRHPASSTCVLIALAASSLLLPGTASADFRLSVTGTFHSSDNETYRFDGTNSYENDLPPLLDLDRLRGGTFSASFLFPQVPPAPSGNNATYSFGQPYGMEFQLFDAAGSAVHVGTSSSDAFALIFNDIDFGTKTDQASFFAFVNSVTGLRVPTEVYTPDQGLSVFQSGLIFSGRSAARRIISTTSRSRPKRRSIRPSRIASS